MFMFHLKKLARKGLINAVLHGPAAIIYSTSNLQNMLCMSSVKLLDTEIYLVFKAVYFLASTHTLKLTDAVAAQLVLM